MSSSGSLFDTNVWIALSFARHAGFERAREEFERHDSNHPIVVCRSVQQSFLRLITTKSIQQAYQQELITNREAWTRWYEILALPQVQWLDEPAGLESHWAKNAALDSASSKHWMDAYLGAFVLSHKIKLTTFDKAFISFKEVKVELLKA